MDGEFVTREFQFQKVRLWERSPDGTHREYKVSIPKGAIMS